MSRFPRVGFDMLRFIPPFFFLSFSFSVLFPLGRGQKKQPKNLRCDTFDKTNPRSLSFRFLIAFFTCLMMLFLQRLFFLFCLSFHSCGLITDRRWNDSRPFLSRTTYPKKHSTAFLAEGVPDIWHRRHLALTWCRACFAFLLFLLCSCNWCHTLIEVSPILGLLA